MENITNGDISQYTGRSTNTVAGWASKQPKMLEIIRLGALCKKNNLDEEKIVKLIELQELIKGKE